MQPLLLMMHNGGHSLDDFRIVQDDKAMREVLHIDKVPTADGIEHYKSKICKTYFKGIGKPIVLDIDALVIESHKSIA